MILHKKEIAVLLIPFKRKNCPLIKWRTVPYYENCSLAKSVLQPTSAELSPKFENCPHNQKGRFLKNQEPSPILECWSIP
jgi:hypothetical protein